MNELINNRKPARSFTDLLIWQKAHELVISIYKITKEFPQEELFCLTSQLRRAAISIPANICEGFKRSSKREKTRFFNISQSSLEECRYYLILASDLGYSVPEDVINNLLEISKMTESYIKSILNSDF